MLESKHRGGGPTSLTTTLDDTTRLLWCPFAASLRRLHRTPLDALLDANLDGAPGVVDIDHESDTVGHAATRLFKRGCHGVPDGPARRRFVVGDAGDDVTRFEGRGPRLGGFSFSRQHRGALHQVHYRNVQSVCQFLSGVRASPVALFYPADGV